MERELFRNAVSWRRFYCVPFISFFNFILYFSCGSSWIAGLWRWFCNGFKIELL